ncbi:hypothetical protein C4553_01665 [Candidatus Parcubacteria bacterium]|nr:MAG: hypothetical protein C4553_01665 [Candidatus Parcubacteria bacterium]
MRLICYKKNFISAFIIFTLFVSFFATTAVFGQEETETNTEEADNGLSEEKLIELEQLQKELEVKEQEARELEEKAEELNQSIEETQKQKDSLTKEIQLLNSRINKLNLDIKYTQNRISKTNLEINSLEYKIEEKIFEIENKTKAMTSVIQSLYEAEQEQPLIAILRNESISDMVAQINYLSTLESQLLANLRQLKDLRDNLTNEKRKQEGLKTDLTKLKNKLADQQNVEAWQRQQKNQVLKDTKNQEKEYRDLLVETNQRREEIAREIFELEEKIRLTIDPNAIPIKRPGVLGWPVETHRITQTYGPTSKTGFNNDSYNFHNGIDIGLPAGTPVFSAGEGEVIANGNVSPYAYGRWVAIKHPNNLVTLYGHLSVVKVSNGQSVKRGELIAYSGNTGFSTGPHLHFTVYAGDTFKTVQRWFGLLPLGGSVNPLDYLNGK